RNQSLERRSALELERGGFSSHFLASPPTQLRADTGLGFEDRGAIEPPGQGLNARKARRLSSERYEHILGDFLGQCRVADLTERGSVNQIDVPRHKRAERVFRASPGVSGDEFAISGHRCHSIS